MSFKRISAGLIFLTILLTISLSINIFQNKSSILGISFAKPAQISKTIVLVGDSMTEYLGNFELLNLALKKHYPNTTFQLLNYGFGSTNILSVPDRLTKLSDYNKRLLQPINDIPFDLILIESTGNNPLSQYSLEEGTKKQNQTLDQIVSIIIQKHPKSSIVFVATIAPNKDWYGYGALTLSPQQREQWVNERIAYIKNHMAYAKLHNIPLINIFDKSLDSTGQGNIDYLNSNDHIHPSPTGIEFISKEIANFIFKYKLF